MPAGLASAYPGLSAVLADAADPSATPGAPTTATFSTAGGVSWTAFAKGNLGPASESEMFEDLVVPGLQTSMGWQTWRTAYGQFGPLTCAYDTDIGMNNTCGIQPGSLASVNINNLAMPSGVPPPVDQWAAPPVTSWKS